MGYTLTLEVPDEVYNPLVKTAEQTLSAFKLNKKAFARHFLTN